MEIKDVRSVEQIYKSNMTNNDRSTRGNEQWSKGDSNPKKAEASINVSNESDLAKEVAKIRGIGENLDERI